MKNANTAFHELAQDERRLCDLIQSLFRQWLQDLPPDLPDRKKHQRNLPFMLDTLARFNTKWMFYYCESPIERTFVGSVLSVHARWNPLALIVTPNFLHHADPLQAFQSVCKDMESFTAEVRSVDDSPVAFLEHIKNCADHNVISQEACEYMRDHYLFYNFMDMSSAFHLCLQPEIKQIRVAGRTIRPDLLFWCPSYPNFRFVVECDGFDYHSNRDAFTRDRQRDRILRQGGYEVARFSGSEIYRDPVTVAEELVEMLRTTRKRDEKP